MRVQSRLGRVPRALMQHVVRWYAVRENVALGRNVHIGLGSTLWAASGLTVGDDVYIGKRCTIEVDGEIGPGTILGNNVGFVGRHDHDHHAVGVRMRDAPWIGDVPSSIPTERSSVLVGEDCWIGYGATVLSGVTIGRGAIVAAAAVVTQDVEPYQIVAGNPASVIGTRFTEEDRDRHETALGAANRTDDVEGRRTAR